MSIWTTVDVRTKPVTGSGPALEEADRVSRCGGPLSAPLERDRADELALLLKAVADPLRLQLLS